MLFDSYFGRIPRPQSQKTWSQGPAKPEVPLKTADARSSASSISSLSGSSSRWQSLVSESPSTLHRPMMVPSSDRPSREEETAPDQDILEDVTDDEDFNEQHSIPYMNPERAENLTNKRSFHGMPDVASLRGSASTSSKVLPSQQQDWSQLPPNVAAGVNTFRPPYLPAGRQPSQRAMYDPTSANPEQFLHTYPYERRKKSRHYSASAGSISSLSGSSAPVSVTSFSDMNSVSTPRRSRNSSGSTQSRSGNCLACQMERRSSGRGHRYHGRRGAGSRHEQHHGPQRGSSGCKCESCKERRYERDVQAGVHVALAHRANKAKQQRHHQTERHRHHSPRLHKHQHHRKHDDSPRRVFSISKHSQMSSGASRHRHGNRRSHSHRRPAHSSTQFSAEEVAQLLNMLGARSSR